MQQKSYFKAIIFRQGNGGVRRAGVLTADFRINLFWKCKQIIYLLSGVAKYGQKIWTGKLVTPVYLDQPEMSCQEKVIIIFENWSDWE